jgi:hypothetical protein
MAQRRLARIVLPIGVGDEADGSVEGEVRRDVAEALWVQGQVGLEPQDRVKGDDADHAEGEHGQCVGEPALLPHRIDAGGRVKAALDRANNGREQVGFTGKGPRQLDPKRLDEDKNGEKEQADLCPADESHGEISARDASEPLRPDERHDQVGGKRNGN